MRFLVRIADGARGYIAKLRLLLPIVRRFAGSDAARWAVALGIALPALYWVILSTWVASYNGMGRDQGTFHYSGWALGHGERLYRDARDANGPMGAYVHWLFLRLGGADDHIFRLLELGTTGLVFALVGFFLPGFVLKSGTQSEKPSLLVRLCWALAFWTLLSAQYELFSFWTQAQRDGYALWFILPGYVAQVIAHVLAAERRRERLAQWLFVLSGFLVATSCIAKPTMLLYCFAQMLTVLVDTELAGRRKKLLGRLCLGMLGAAVFNFLLLAVVGSPIEFLRINLIDIPKFYPYIWEKGRNTIMNAYPVRWSLVVSAAIIGMIAMGQLPRRFVGVALGALVGLASVLVQNKGFEYHYQPLGAFMWIQGGLLALWLAETFLPQKHLRAIPLAGVLVLAFFSVEVATTSPQLAHLDFPDRFATPQSRKTDLFYNNFNSGSFQSGDLHHAAENLKSHTKPTDRVYLWGIDPYVLFLAERKAATRYVAAGWELNMTAALAGSPNPARSKIITDYQLEQAKRLARELAAQPPAALVIMDGLYWGPDGWADLQKWCPDAGKFLKERYTETIRFGKARLFFPK
jgi:hypothetical protein